MRYKKCLSRLVGRWLLFLLLVLVAFSCFWGDENTQVYLVKRYYIETSADTHTTLYFDDSREEAYEPLLSNVSAIGMTANYLAVRDEDKYYLFISDAASSVVARKTAVGPLDVHTFRKNLQQLTGDSMLQLSSKF